MLKVRVKALPVGFAFTNRCHPYSSMKIETITISHNSHKRWSNMIQTAPNHHKDHHRTIRFLPTNIQHHHILNQLFQPLMVRHGSPTAPLPFRLRIASTSSQSFFVIWSKIRTIVDGRKPSHQLPLGISGLSHDSYGFLCLRWSRMACPLTLWLTFDDRFKECVGLKKDLHY